MSRTFSDTAYKEPPRIDLIKSRLVEFGYAKLDARRLAYAIVRNLDNYLAVQQAVGLARQQELERVRNIRPTQTSRRSYANV
jgi:hypothetical protein